MRKTKLLITATGVILVSILLGGCSDVLLSPEQVVQQQAAQQQQLKHRCDKSDYLLSDLTKPINKRVYSLKPGVTCND